MRTKARHEPFTLTLSPVGVNLLAALMSLIAGPPEALTTFPSTT